MSVTSTGKAAIWETHKLLFVNQQDTGVCFEVHPLSVLNDLKTLDCDIGLVGEAQAYEVQHCAILGSCSGIQNEGQGSGWLVKITAAQLRW